MYAYVDTNELRTNVNSRMVIHASTLVRLAFTMQGIAQTPLLKEQNADGQLSLLQPQHQPPQTRAVTREIVPLVVAIAELNTMPVRNGHGLQRL